MLDNIIVSLIGTIVPLATLIVSVITNRKTQRNNDLREDMNKYQSEIKKELNSIKLNACKRFLVTQFKEIESGVDKTDVEKAIINEAFDEYTKLGGNSYIHTEYTKLVNTNLL